MMPHAMCLMWNARLMAMHIVSDSAIAGAYYFIALELIRLTRHHFFGNIIGHTVAFGLATLFIASGTIQLFDIVTLWRSLYWVDAWLKAITGVIAVATAVMFRPIVRHYLRRIADASL